ncbi:MAG: hypothetical protein DRI84_04335 [Bacteroidetes bacterium]|nr:MAG: hypothetical protein DRI84_04335 [Bacteroidota bacterium]
MASKYTFGDTPKEKMVKLLGKNVALVIIIPFLIELGLALMMAALMAKSVKTNLKLTKTLNDYLKDGNKWKVHLVKEKIPNAFVIMGKHIFITTGLEKILTERELMAVMLHELHHLKNNDVLKTVIGKHSLGGILLGACALFGGAASVAVGLILYMIFGMAFINIMMNRLLGRRQEIKADNYAVKFGYADELVSALNKLEKVFNKLKAQMRQGKDCGKLCKLGEKINEKMDEHPPLKQRTEQILKKKETWAVAMTKPFTGIRKFLFKQFGVKKEAK